jgi:flagellar biosynthesis protein FlhF
MRIKKYKAPSLKSGKDKILEELGEDAVILSTRTIKSTSPNEPDYIEIVAATDDKPIEAHSNTPLRKETISIQNALKTKEHENEMLLGIQKIQDDLNQLKSVVSIISDSIRYKYSSNFSGDMERLYKYLRQEGFGDDTVLKVIGQISTAGLSDNLHKAIEKAKEILTRNITIMPPLKKEKSRKIAFFMGPTGSGKTSTLVKLAIISKLIHKTDALIISADTDKVGGADQLQTFATIAGIPFETAYTPKELRELLEKEEKRELIFIDTTGKSQNNSEHLKELSVFLESSKPDFRYLIISCTTDKATFKQTLEKFEKLKPSGIVITKFDEAASVGSLIEILREVKFPLAYFTNGQKIPEDIEPAGKEFLNKIVFRNLELV